MNDFAKKRKPTTAEYLSATEEQIIDRMNLNPSSTETETRLLETLLSYRAEKEQLKVGLEMLKETRNLVRMTAALNGATIFAVVCGVGLTYLLR